MKLIFSDKLLKSIPSERYERVLREINNFNDEYKSNNLDIKQMRKGWYVREIHGTTRIKKVYKLRVNIKDRLLFTFGKFLGLRSDFNNSIIFLEFCNHDRQIYRGENINITSKNLEYNEEFFDNYIDEIFKDYNYNIDKSINRVITVEELKEMLEGKDDRATYYLNDQQFQLISKDLRPLFLFGSAGSGKTTIAINKVYSLCKANDKGDIKIGYFTYSNFLVDEAKSMFRKIVKEEQESIDKYEKNTSFCSVNQYLLKEAKKPSMVSYDEFKIWLDNYLNKTLGKKICRVQPIDIWREIRGILKGLVQIDYLSVKVPFEKLSKEFIEFLCSKKFNDDGNSFILINGRNLADLNNQVSYCSKNNQDTFKKYIETIYDSFDEILCNTKLIEKDLYFNLKEEYSIFNRQDKEFIYNLAVKYQQWLDSNNKFDENDLVRIALNKMKYNGNGNFDYIICDEIQDLSELQIYYLFKIIKNKKNLLFSGDFNQTINPTFFDTGRVEALFKKYNGTLSFNNEIIQTNYRSSKSIVEFSKRLTILKNITIDKKKMNKFDYIEEGIREYASKITFIDAKAISKEKLLEFTKRRAYCDVLVADDEEKVKLINCSSPNKLVFSVSDYKGLENEYIIGYNILSKFKDKWKQILSKEFKCSVTELKYYFNMFYVFITRARDNICIIEEDMPEELLEWFKDFLEVLDNFDISKLNLQRISSNDEHYKKAINFEKNEMYLEAVEAYRNAEIDSTELQRAVDRCNSLYKNKQGLHNEAGDELMEIGEYEYAYLCYFAAENYLEVIHAMTLNNNSYGDMVQVFSKVELEPMAIVMKNNSVPWLNKFNEIYQYHLDGELSRLKNYVIGIEETVEKFENSLE